MKKTKLLLWKVIAVWAVFLLLHYSYETFPNTLFQIIGEDGETTYFHMKMLFFAYIFITVVEFFVKRNKIKNVEGFVYSRMLVAVAYPWLTITMWFTAEALGIHLPLIPWEIIYANVFTIIGAYLAVRMDEALESIVYRPAFRNLVILLFLTALLSYVAFSFNTPEHFFSSPEGI